MVERWERRLQAAERKPPPASESNVGSQVMLAHAVAKFAGAVPNIEPGTNVTITVDNGPGRRTSVRVSWDAHGQVHIAPVGTVTLVNEH